MATNDIIFIEKKLLECSKELRSDDVKNNEFDKTTRVNFGEKQRPLRVDQV